MHPPVVSVILPAFNRLKHLCAAVESVLAQTFDDWELVIVDDGSDEPTRHFLGTLNDARVRTSLLRHTGIPSVVRNAGLRLACGQYVAFLDSDDLWAPTKLETQLRMMHAHPDRRWSYSKETFIDELGQAVSDKDFPPWIPYEGLIVEPLLKIEALVSTPTVMAERSLVHEAGGFDEEQHFGEDYDLWLRLAMRSGVSAMSEPLVSVRLHKNSFSADRIGAFEGWVRLYGKMSGLVSDKRLRSICNQRRRDNSLILAGLYGQRGDFPAVAKTLVKGTASLWSDPRWWLGVTKAVVRTFLPDSVVASYRKRKRQPVKR